ncbi:hypothetical protein [Micromonospora maris]|uniref:hypothetical protein n=1 Tax=Micromonospora maris TaxID=1003110 RepID=UPI002E143177|nr:hypothetical protein OG712_15510 [Micromonospora maris]
MSLTEPPRWDSELIGAESDIRNLGKDAESRIDPERANNTRGVLVLGMEEHAGSLVSWLQD